MAPHEPPELISTRPALELVSGLADDSVKVARYFDAFDWEGAAPDPGLSAEDFFAALS